MERFSSDRWRVDVICLEKIQEFLSENLEGRPGSLVHCFMKTIRLILKLYGNTAV